MKRKITVTTGTRADYGILKPVLSKIELSKNLELHLIVTGMHLSKKYGYTINEILKDSFKISSKIEMVPKIDSSLDTAIQLGEGIKLFAKQFKKIQPDINLVLGDRDEMLASAIAAYHMNIPNAHIHGGDKTMGGIDEYTRHAITKISNIHFPASKKSYDRIKKLGENIDYVYLTGSPSIDDITTNKISSRKNIENFFSINVSENYIVLLQHPVTTQSELSEKQIIEILKAINTLKIRTIAIAPNSDTGNSLIFEQLLKFSKKNPYFTLFSNLPRKDFLSLLKHSSLLLGNSSSGMIEASYFNTSVINLGIRQKDRERGTNVIDIVDFNQKSIVSAMKKVLKLKNKKSQILKIYGNGNSSQKIVNKLEKIKLDKCLIQKQITY